MAERETAIIRRLVIRMLIAMTVAGAAAAYYAYTLENTYRARALLILAPLPLEQNDQVPGNIAAMLDPTRRVNYIKVQMAEALPMPDYRLILTSEEITARLRDLLRERYEAAGIDAENLSIERVGRSLELRSRVHLQTPLEIQYQQVVELLVTARNPKIAAEAANAWAEMGIEMAERMRTAAGKTTAAFLQECYDTLWAEYTEVREQLEQLERSLNIEAMEERIAEHERAITRQQLIHLEGGGAPQEQTAAALIKTLTESTAALRAELARSKREHDTLQIRSRAQVQQLDELGVSLHAARMAAADAIPEFKIASRALPPEEKHAPRRSLYVVVAIFLAATAVPVHLFGMIALRRYARSLESGVNGGV